MSSDILKFINNKKYLEMQFGKEMTSYHIEEVQDFKIAIFSIFGATKHGGGVLPPVDPALLPYIEQFFGLTSTYLEDLTKIHNSMMDELNKPKLIREDSEDEEE